jgi:hypothetical protein
LANWYYFRTDGVRGRDITVILTDVVGEYNDKPGANGPVGLQSIESKGLTQRTLKPAGGPPIVTPGAVEVHYPEWPPHQW